MVRKKPMVSVIVQTYRHERFIKTCIDSILDQERSFAIEILIGVDISDDSTEQLCLEYAEKYPDIISIAVRDPKDKIILFGQPTGRYNFHQNLLTANGKYIAILEGDDYWIDKKKLKKQVEFMDQSEASICFTRWKTLKGSEELVKPSSEKFSFSRTKPHKITPDNFYEKFCATTCTCLFKRSLLDHDLILNHPTSLQDTFLFYFLVSQSPGYLLPGITSVYRLHSGGTYSLKPAIQRYRASAWTINKMLKTPLKSYHALQKRYTRILYYYLKASFHQGDFREIIRAGYWMFLHQLSLTIGSYKRNNS